MQDFIQDKMQMVKSSEENGTRFRERKAVDGSRDEKNKITHGGWKAIRILQNTDLMEKAVKPCA